MKSLDIPILITPTLTLPYQEENSGASGWALDGSVRLPPMIASIFFAFGCGND
ncbi:MAG: hypothetical protein ABSF48_01445 [Thermodesulfobacteriota bacterium]